MKSKFAVMLALVGLTTISPVAQAADLRSIPGAEKIQADLLAKIEVEVQEQSSGKALSLQKPNLYRIVVSLKAPQNQKTLAMNYQSAEGLAQIQRDVEALQDAVLKAPARGSLSILHRYQSFYGFSAEADREAILNLAILGEVEVIEEIPVMYKMDAQSHPLTNINKVHRKGYTGKGVTIAIIDDGIDHDHAAFGGSSAWPNAKILGGHDFADNDSNPRIDCVNQGHGTAVAGVAAGNGGGVTGTAPDARIVFLKVQTASECGQRTLSGDITAAIDWAVTNRGRFGIDIISMSLGGITRFRSARACDNSHSAYRKAVRAARNAGIVVFAAAGNGGDDSALSPPACLSDVISVGAVFDDNLGPIRFSGICEHKFTAADLVSCYSNSAQFLDILAPAHDAFTARVGGGTRSRFGGTSAAAPFAAGVAATLLEAFGDGLDNHAMRRLLAGYGIDILDAKSHLFTPRINAEASQTFISSIDKVHFGFRGVIPVPGDYDGDGQTDIAVYHQAEGMWHIVGSRTGYRVKHLGWSATDPVPGDYDGDGQTDIAVYHQGKGMWRIVGSRTGYREQQLGGSATDPVPGDYDGDGQTDIAVYHQAEGMWHIVGSRTGYRKQQLGGSATDPVPGDYDGDGQTDIAVYHQGKGMWHIVGSRTGYRKQQLGGSATDPVPGDYDGDGRTDIAVYHQAAGDWYLLYSDTNTYKAMPWLWKGEPVPGDYNGDGQTDLAVVDPQKLDWYLQR